MSDESSGVVALARPRVKLYATGKCIVQSTAPADHAGTFEVALKRAARVHIYIDPERFVSELRQRGVSEDVARAAIPTVMLDDEVWLQDRMPL